MVIDLTDILQNEGKIREITAEIDMDSVSSRLGSFPIVRKSPVSLRLTNEGKRKIRLEGSAEITVQIPCDRCLKETERTLPLEFERELDMNSTPEERAEDLEEQAFLEGCSLNLDCLIRGEILISWPMKVLCREDCRGICSRCGADLNLGDCECGRTELDPRMARFLDVFAEMNM